MAKTNFGYEKRQRELEKKKKADEKARKKLESKNHPAEGEPANEDAHAAQDSETTAQGEQQA